MTQNILVSSVRFVAIELIGDVAYFPVWWYSKGMKKFLLFFWQKIIVTQRGLGVGIWLSNLFKPMYAQEDWQGKIISFLMRIFQIIIRSIALLVWTIVIFVAFIIWAILPLVIAYQIYRVSINMIK